MSTSKGNAQPGFLLLEDGTLFRGLLHAESGKPVAAEVVFTTNMSGYQEVFSDPSYLGQIVVMTAPMIGNYGINAEDPESSRPQVSGIVVRELSTTYSNWRAGGDLAGYLRKAQIPVLHDVDTRHLTRHLRSVGVLRGVIGSGEDVPASARATLEHCESMSGLDLASRVTTQEPYEWTERSTGARSARKASAKHIVAYDYGIKHNILRLFEERDCRVTVVPAATSSDDVLARAPDGVFLSNGPGDPEAVAYAPEIIRGIAERGVPIFGICLGHQIIGLAFGATTFKLPYGHRGGNHPVREIATGRVIITSQNHGFSVIGSAAGIPGAPDLQVTHVNLNDGSVEGLRHKDLPIFAVQFHPEAAPGPHDARPIFDDFLRSVAAPG